jgi:ribonuclease P protein component
MSFSYQKKYRLLTKKDFGQLSRGNKTKHFPKFQIFLRKSDLPYPRLGITASRKFGKSVKRNLFKRRTREVFRKHFKEFSHIEILVRAKNQVETPTYEEIFEAFQQTLIPAPEPTSCST